MSDMPIRQDITVIEGDDTKKLKINWCVYEYQGCEVFSYFDGWVKQYDKAIN